MKLQNIECSLLNLNTIITYYTSNWVVIKSMIYNIQYRHYIYNITISYKSIVEVSMIKLYVVYKRIKIKTH